MHEFIWWFVGWGGKPFLQLTNSWGCGVEEYSDFVWEAFLLLVDDDVVKEKMKIIWQEFSDREGRVVECNYYGISKQG